MNDEKFIRMTKRAEIVMAVTVVVLCASLILRLTDGDWLGSIVCVTFLVVVYHYFKQTRVLSLLMRYIDILEAERDYNEKSIEAYEKMCQAQKEIIDNLKQMVANKDEIISNQEVIIANEEKISKNWEKAVNRLVCEQVENERFIPSEGGE